MRVRMLRIAVLGTGRHSSSNHGPSLKSIKEKNPNEIELAAVCDLDEDRAKGYAMKFGFGKVYRDQEDMLTKEKLDGIIAVTPIPLTAGIVGELLVTGIPILMEKPPGRSSEETKRLLKIAEEHQTPHMVSFNRRFNPALARARDWLAQGNHKIQLVISRMLRHARPEPDFVTITGIHAIDTVISLVNPPDRVVTHKVQSGGDGSYIYDASLSFSGGRTADLIIAPQVGTIEETYEILGSDFSIQVDTLKCRVRIYEGGDLAMSWRPPEDREPTLDNGALDETAAFIESIRSGRSFRPNLEDGLRSMLTAEAVQEGGEREVS